jgi:sugar phosphate isomerase/epimerase
MRLVSPFVLSAFGDEISPHLDEEMQVLKQHGIGYLEARSLEGMTLIDYPLRQVREIYARLADQGLGVSALASPIGKMPIADPFPPHLERFKRALETAEALHTRFIRMFSFYLPEGEDPGRFRDEVLRRWTEFVAAAKGTGLILLHENEKAIYGDTAARCRDLFEALASDWVRAVFDPANFVQCDEEAYPRALEMLDRHVVYLHIKDARTRDHVVVPAGQGDGRVADILRHLHRRDFHGFLSIEPHLADSLPGGGPEQFAVAVRALIDILQTLDMPGEGLG